MSIHSSNPGRKYGKLAPVIEKTTLLMSDFRTTAALPKLPKLFGHGSLVTDWGMLGNDTVGDCAIAMIMHILMQWAAATGKAIRFTTENAIRVYSEVTGYDPSQTEANGNNPTDQGTVLLYLLQYAQKHGIPDADGNIWKIDFFVKLQTGSIQDALIASYLFSGGCALGCQMPSSTQTQFDEQKPWTVTNAPIEGGHAFPIVQRQVIEPFSPLAIPDAVTWEKLQPITVPFYRHYNDEAYGIGNFQLMEDQFGKTIDGFDTACLQNALRALRAA